MPVNALAPLSWIFSACYIMQVNKEPGVALAFYQIGLLQLGNVLFTCAGQTETTCKCILKIFNCHNKKIICVLKMHSYYLPSFRKKDCHQ
ncbi:hypothetical protein XELAEV_18009969mg [Xenopus laevis]|uniref:Uncharacterized protein n=1 Tax=Xenopus laevis TaxID=8355 RepID=A0A974DUJ8_XENLA|nr:hypothetical protein XELAEV_18009969mg [Xenopus laevis]